MNLRMAESKSDVLPLHHAPVSSEEARCIPFPAPSFFLSETNPLAPGFVSAGVGMLRIKRNACEWSIGAERLAPLTGISTWGGIWGSNPRHPEPQSGALPAELIPPYFINWILAPASPRLAAEPSEAVPVRRNKKERSGMEQVLPIESPAETKPSKAGSFRKGRRNLWIWSFPRQREAEWNRFLLTWYARRDSNPRPTA